jgi:hypothetical protein
MPMLVGVNIAYKFNWLHNQITHVDHTMDCPDGTYRKHHATERGNYFYHHLCGQPWCQQERGAYWLSFTDLDGHYRGTAPRNPLPLNDLHQVHSTIQDKMVELLGHDRNPAAHIEAIPNTHDRTTSDDVDLDAPRPDWESKYPCKAVRIGLRLPH